ncbi:UNVERIFIED_CONTAM: hypothetical protein Sradi_7110700 [Sesamum radiatum]|uniref:DUF4283 domain-containing protein n=1 Tax=Sesamum radiatum TaxID=300843 RepID=A0AAW2J0V2_SESRA
MEEVIEGCPWLYLGQPIVLQKWEPGMVLRKLKHTEVPMWIKHRHLPVELWTTEGLSTVASGIGRPLYPNAITRACTRLDFARVCVMLNAIRRLHVPNNKIEKPKVAVYVQKRPVQPPPTVSKPMAKDAVRTVQHTVPEEDGTGAFWNVRGLNRRDHQVAVKELVNEFRLNFLGLFETRVSAVNIFTPGHERVPGLYPRHRINTYRFRENYFLGIIAVKEIVAYGNVWIDCWLMMLATTVAEFALSMS